MNSTAIALLLATTVVLWQAPFLKPLLQIWRRRWRVALFIGVLVLLYATATHTHVQSTTAKMERQNLLHWCKTG